MTVTTAGGAGEAAELARAEPPARRPRRIRVARGRKGEGLWGWTFVTPALLVLLVFLIIPIALAIYVSFTDWNGQGGPFSSSAQLVGLQNYKDLLFEDGLVRRNFVAAVRNNLYFVLIVVPVQTALALSLALIVNQRRLKGKGFFRTAFYMPSVSSSIAISLIFVFLFAQQGAINTILGWFGLGGRQWFNNGEGTFHAFLGLFGVDSAPAFLADHEFLGMSWWDWLSGPSWSMVVIITLVVWTTAGTFMLMFLAGLQTVPEEVLEAAAIDGATRWQSFRKVTLPLLRPSVILVVTLGLIGTWQVFDQIFVISEGQGNTNTPAYLSYTTGIRDNRFGRASAIAFLLFLIILFFTLVQRVATRQKDGAS